MSILFTVSVPTYTNMYLYSIINTLCCSQIIPNTSTEYTHSVYIKNDILHADVNYKIYLFLKKVSSYIIYSKEYSSIYPILVIDIWDDRVFIRFMDFPTLVFTGDRMHTFYNNIENAYKEYNFYTNPNYYI